MDAFTAILLIIVGWLLGYACASSKYVRKQRKRIKEKGEKYLKEYSDAEKEAADYLPIVIKGVARSVDKVEDEDTKTAELKIERDTEGSPEDA